MKDHTIFGKDGYKTRERAEACHDISSQLQEGLHFSCFDWLWLLQWPVSTLTKISLVAGEIECARETGSLQKVSR